MNLSPATFRRRKESGQTLVMFVFFLVVLLLFVGLGIDVGFAYVTKAQLSKAVDAAALTGMKTLSFGQATATSAATATFKANYGTPGRDIGSVTPTITFAKASNGVNTLLTVSATTTINTFFIRILPFWKTLQVSASAQTTRSELIMSVVLDRSGSMNPDTGTTKGGQYLPSAVIGFINLFDDSLDLVSMVSFSSTANTDFPVTRPFKSGITTAVNNLIFAGGTFSPGGLTNGIVQNNSVNVASGVDAVKIVVFFTDGYANMIDGTYNCPAQTVYNFGGYDNSGSGVDVFLPNAARDANTQSANACTAPENGNFSCCSAANSFFSQQFNSNKPFTTDNVTAESKYRCIQLANQMRAAGMYVYSIGLSASSDLAVQLSFLQQVANDPDSISYDPTQPVGQAVVTTDASQLNPLFQQIANRILLRLTQ